MKKIRIGTWNVNSVRARFDQIRHVLDCQAVDILLLQETKVQDKDFPEFFFRDFGYNTIFAGQKSYNGVAIISKIPIESIMTSLPLYDLYHHDDEARYIEAGITINKNYLTISSVYVPNGASNDDDLEKSERFLYKLRFLDRLMVRLKSFDLKNDFVLFGGDFNVANDEIDLFNPAQNKGCIGFHDKERMRIKSIISSGLYDLYRNINGNKVEYTWWDYRTKAFDRDLGWRIDYMFGSRKVVDNLLDCKILKSIRGMEKSSDHTLVFADISLE